MGHDVLQFVRDYLKETKLLESIRISLLLWIIYCSRSLPRSLLLILVVSTPAFFLRINLALFRDTILEAVW